MKATITIEGDTTISLPNIVEGDYGYNIQFNVKQNNSDAFDLTDYTVTFKASKYGQCSGTEVNQIDSACTVTSSLAGIATCTLLSSDTETYGRYKAELECTNTSEAIVLTASLGDLIILEQNP